MASTVIRGAQIKDSTVQRHDLDTGTVGQAVVTKLVQGSGITLSSTGADSGTGDVTVAASTIPLASSAQSGLLKQTSGNTTDFIDGTNNSQPLQPVIWSVRLRSFNALGNPTFEVDQRNVGTALIGSYGFIVDRWQGGKTSGSMSASFQQGVGPILLPGTNFAISSSFLHIQLTTQQATLAAGDVLSMNQNIEGINVRELSSDVTSLQVLVRSSVAGLTFGLGIRDGGATRSLTKLATITTAGTWQLLTFPNIPVFPSSGSFPITPGNAGAVVTFCFASGATYQSPANNTWQNGNFLAAAGQANFAASPVNSTFDIAFVQHEPGAQCTTPIDCPFGQNYDGDFGCVRYYCKSYDYPTAIGTVTTAGMGSFTAASGHGSVWGSIPFPKRMATLPSVTIYNPATGAANSARDAVGTDYTVSGLSNAQSALSGFNISPALGASGAGMPVRFHYTADTGW